MYRINWKGVMMLGSVIGTSIISGIVAEHLGLADNPFFSFGRTLVLVCGTTQSLLTFQDK